MDPMLIEYGLFGKGLINVDTPQGVSRYNEALVDFGITPTKLSAFRIDGIGWSPEIAAECGNSGYLGHGDANRVAIIASPDQDRKPIFLPTHSFERRLMGNFFDRSKREIADITTSACVRLDLENNILSYDSPKDLLELESVTVNASAGSLMEAANTQKELDAKFMEDGGEDDPALRAAMMESAKAHGDLRRRRTEIPKFLFSLIGTFWTRALGGVFVLRAGADTILVLEDKKMLAKALPGRNERLRSFAIGQNDLADHLLEEDLLEVDLRRFQSPEGLKQLENLEYFITADAVCRAEPDCDFDKLTVSKRKGILLSCGEQMSLLTELRKFKRALEQRNDVPDRISSSLRLLLLRPNEMLTGEQYQNVLWMLLQRMQEDPADVLTLYTYDKERFFALFETWPLAKKRWAAAYVSARYQPEMNRMGVVS